MDMSEDQLRTLATSERLDLPSGGFLRITTEPDHYTTVNDFGCYGRVEWSHRKNYMGYAIRPEGFDGAAEKLDTDRGSVLWWQPYTPDKAARRQWHTDPEYRRTMRRLVRDIVAYGFQVWRVEYCHGTDAYGRDVVRDFATLGGIDPGTDLGDELGYLSDLVAQLDMSENVAA